MSFDISIVIVNFNGKKYLKNLFDSLLEIDCTTFTFEIVFVDNNSSDDSITYLEKEYKPRMKNLKIIQTGKNLGFAGGNNYGVQHSTGKYIVFLNNDTVVSREWLTNLYQCILNTDAGIVNSKLVFFYDFLKLEFKTRDKIFIGKEVLINNKPYMIDPKFCFNLLYESQGLTCFGHSYIYIPLIDDIKDYKIEISILGPVNQQFDFLKVGEESYSPNDTNGFSVYKNSSFVKDNKITIIQNVGSGIDKNYNGYDVGFCQEDNGQYEEVREIECACGAAMIVKKEDFLRCGGFDDEFFMYYEDTDLSFRIKKLGKKLIYCPSAVVRHIHTGSSKEWSPFFTYQVIRNRLWFILKNFSFSIFIRQFTKSVFETIRGLFSKSQHMHIKKAKINAIFSTITYTGRYIIKNKNT